MEYGVDILLDYTLEYIYYNIYLIDISVFKA